MNLLDIKYAIYITATICAVLTVLFSCSDVTHEPIAESPDIVVRAAATPPSIDGILDDECWKDTEGITLKNSLDGGRPAFPTTVRLAYSGELLFLGFECQDIDAAGDVAERDGRVSAGDFVSCLIDADGDTSTSVIIEVSPAGGVFDAFMLADAGGIPRKVLKEWDCDGLSVSSTVYGGGAAPGTSDRFWTVEMSLPFSSFHTSRIASGAPSGSAWHMNFFRREMSEPPFFASARPTGSGNAGYRADRALLVQFAD